MIYIKALLILLLIFLYFRKTINKLLENRKINYLFGLYNAYEQATNDEEKFLAFKKIAQNRPLSDDLIGSFYFSSPSYDEFRDIDKIRNTYIRLHEAFDHNYYWAKKYLHPKYLIKDIFFLPGELLSFLFSREFNKLPSFFVSCFTWVATILISAYATELRTLINVIIEKFI